MRAAGIGEADTIELQERRVQAPRYTPGQHVTVVDPRDIKAAWNGGYMVTTVIPSADGALPARYHILSAGGAHSRWAEEHQLTSAFRIESA